MLLDVYSFYGLFVLYFCVGLYARVRKFVESTWQSLSSQSFLIISLLGTTEKLLQKITILRQCGKKVDILIHRFHVF